MNRVYQKITKKDDKTDNFQAAMNSLLEVDDFPDLREDSNWVGGMEEYLTKNKFFIQDVVTGGEEIDPKYKGMKGLFLGRFYTNEDGDNRVVVVDRNKNVVHDPDPTFKGEYNFIEVWIIQKGVEMDFSVN